MLSGKFMVATIFHWLKSCLGICLYLLPNTFFIGFIEDNLYLQNETVYFFFPKK